jgi:hypothetical protein
VQGQVQEQEQEQEQGQVQGQVQGRLGFSDSANSQVAYLYQKACVLYPEIYRYRETISWSARVRYA